MVAVHDPKMIRDESCCRTERAHVLGHNNPALCHRGFQRTLVIDATEPWPMLRQRDRINSVGCEVFGKPTRVVLIQQEPNLDTLRPH